MAVLTFGLFMGEKPLGSSAKQCPGVCGKVLSDESWECPKYPPGLLSSSVKATGVF